MTKTIAFIEHKIQPEPDAGQLHLLARGVDLRIIHPFAGDALPDLDGLDGLIVMGGPQMLTEIDKYPYLTDEAALLLAASHAKLPGLAICLGAQLLAHALGANVDWHPENAVAFGYHPLETTAAARAIFPPDMHVLSGNAQGFDMPKTATPLAHGALWPNQAFSMGNTLAFQFHPEITRGLLNNWQNEMAANIGRAGATDLGQQNADFAQYDGTLKQWYRDLLDHHFSLI